MSKGISSFRGYRIQCRINDEVRYTNIRGRSAWGLTETSFYPRTLLFEVSISMPFFHSSIISQPEVLQGLLVFSFQIDVRSAMPNCPHMYILSASSQTPPSTLLQKQKKWQVNYCGVPYKNWNHQNYHPRCNQSLNSLLESARKIGTCAFFLCKKSAAQQWKKTLCWLQVFRNRTSLCPGHTAYLRAAPSSWQPRMLAS